MLTENESTPMEALYKANKDFVEAAKKSNHFNGLKRHLSEFYPEVAHYIYELLQNAEDALAKKVTFNLFRDRMEFIHDGTKLFDIKDIESITNISESGKINDVTVIGKFGIGFKSVFAYTETPTIYSGDYAFEIIDLFIPTPLSNHESVPITKFILPFNHNKKTSEDAFDETKNVLLNFNDNVLLFMNNIELIEWSIEGTSGHICKIQYEVNHFEIERKVDSTSSNKHWLIFKHDYTCGIKHLPIAVAFELAFTDTKKNIQKKLYDENLPLSQQFEIVPVDNEYLKGQTSIFFPCDKEEPKLNFHINGPFSSTADRSKLIYTNKDNMKIIEAISELIVTAIENIKEIGFFNRNFYKILPNTNDVLNEFYTPIMNRLFVALTNLPLMPTLNEENKYAPGKLLVNTYQSVKELFVGHDFKLFLSEDQLNVIGWVDGLMVGAGRREERREEQLLKDLKIHNFDWDGILYSVYSKFSYSRENSSEIFGEKDDSWFRRFYLMLNEARSKAGNYNHIQRLQNCFIVLTQSGQFLKGESVFFPIEKRSPIIKEQPKLKSEMLEDLKEESMTKIIEFFNDIGVKRMNEEEEVHILLEAYYGKNSRDPESEKKHYEHLRKFINAWHNNKYKYKELFAKYYIIQSVSDEYNKPSGLYLDKPYKDTELRFFYKSINGSKLAVSNNYSKEFKKTLPKFISFLIDIGVHETIKIDQTNISLGHPDNYSIMRNDYKSKNCIDNDYVITNLEIALNKKDVRISKLVWNRMIKADASQLKICYQSNSRAERYNRFPSSLVYSLRNLEWIPDNKGEFFAPKHMIKERLNKHFSFNNDNGWLTAIGFGAEGEKIKKEYQEKVELYGKLGIREQDVEDFIQFRELPFDQRKKILQKITQQKEFPIRTSENPVRRSLKISQAALEAQDIEYDERMRSVRITNSNIVKDARFFLLQNYTLENGEMICQICEEEMPFKLDTGIPYFEAVQLVENSGKEFDKNYIALCPICAAKFKYTNPDRDELKTRILETEELIIHLILAKEEMHIRFVETHLLDIKAQLSNS